MFSLKFNKSRTLSRLPNHVRDVTTASCVFCPYGADVNPGDRVYAFDEKTLFGRRQRDRLVEVTAVKSFRSTGRLITLALKITRESELLRIAEDSEIPMETLYEHRSGNETYIEGRQPVVVYFKPCNEDDTVAAQSKSKVHTLRPRQKKSVRFKVV